MKPIIAAKSDNNQISTKTFTIGGAMFTLIGDKLWVAVINKKRHPVVSKPNPYTDRAGVVFTGCRFLRAIRNRQNSPAWVELRQN